jgi:uncharacterized protein YqhQ
MKLAGISWKNGTLITNGTYSLEITADSYQIRKRIISPHILVFFAGIDLALFLLVLGIGYISVTFETGDVFSAALLAVIAWSFNIYMFWRIFGKRLREWHGLEHKLIAAAEHNDVKNAATYSPINDRCGGTYFLSIPVYLALATTLTVVLGIAPFGVLTLTGCLMTIEAKTFHQYNIPGIRFGRWLQKHVTTREPGADLLEKGIPAMEQFMGLVGTKV